ncbi:MAG: hypothetical protein HY717_23140 [Planctomycetes bacterium]|nr:hypothetical protein [Planctomycetota bacterium]
MATSPKPSNGGMNKNTVAGNQLIKLCRLAFKADLPLLLIGNYGIGKSEILVQAAESLGIDYRVLDLSLMEPPDLLGLPRIGEDGRMHYALLSSLPTSGRGLFIIEEPNRAPRYMQAPCYRLLTARCLNDYRLPKGWLPCASINPPGEEFHVADLDPVLESRFLCVEVVPEAEEWALWAEKNGIHARIIEFVKSCPGIFKDPKANPRSWTMASKFLKVCEVEGTDSDLLTQGFSGLVGTRWALAFLRMYRDKLLPLKPAEIIEEYPFHRNALKSWIRKSCLDIVDASLELLKRYLQPQAVYGELIRNETHKANVQNFLADLPAEFKKQMAGWLRERGFENLMAEEE